MKVGIIIEDMDHLDIISLPNSTIYTADSFIYTTNTNILNLAQLDFQANDVIILINPSQILSTNDLHPFIIQIDFQLNILTVLTNPKLSTVPLIISLDDDVLTVKISENFAAPKQPCEIAYHDIEFLQYDDQTVVFTPIQQQEDALKLAFQGIRLPLDQEWNYFQLNDYPNIQQQVIGRKLQINGARGQFYRNELQQDYYYCEEKSVFSLAERIIAFKDSVHHARISYSLIKCERSKSQLIYCDDSNIQEMQKCEKLTIFGSQSLIKIQKNITPKFGKSLLSRIEKFPCFESCVVNTHPYHSSHAAVWAKEMADDIILMTEQKLEQSHNFLKFIDFWPDFFDFYFKKEVDSLVQLDIFQNEKIMPVYVKREIFLQDIGDISGGIKTRQLLYKFRCEQFSIALDSYEYEIGVQFQEFNSDFSFISQNLSCFYKLFEFNYEKMPPCDPNEWKSLNISAKTVGQLVEILEKQGIGISSLFSSVGKFLWPGSSNTQLSPGMEIVIDTEDGEELPNVIIE
ncbi:hypothetical protein SS50377_26772 [Spironucleus salmonicida]|uniref:Uncharacterized protein n=1 Tax=Spironucleus salmonicida TaxID=348837 RepID=V6LZR7_9EUKA|nr:hypothetical protein SS50377_26772 [Spironucleus salmonicida]|eukprot:EST49241.1 Hypothetical protein SS50377_10461 [Spironucleus salmonicida]